MSTLRSQLADRIRPLLPSDYRLRPNSIELEQIANPVVQMKQMRIRPADEAPMGHLTVEFIFTMVVPNTKPQAAEDRLDDDVTEVLAALDHIPELNWTLAEKRTAGPNDQYLAYDITLTFNTDYDPEA